MNERFMFVLYAWISERGRALEMKLITLKVIQSYTFLHKANARQRSIKLIFNHLHISETVERCSGIQHDESLFMTFSGTMSRSRS